VPSAQERLDAAILVWKQFDELNRERPAQAEDFINLMYAMKLAIFQQRK
jgi:hypothetical protein